jgi:hypothetical protein
MRLIILLPAAMLIASGTVSASDWSAARADGNVFNDNEVEVALFSDYSHGQSDSRGEATDESRDVDAAHSKGDIVPPTAGVTFEPHGVDRWMTANHETHREVSSGGARSEDIFGGGVSATVFTKRYFGLGVGMDGLAGARAVSLLEGRLLVRYPVTTTFLGGRRGIAPYVFVGGGAAFDRGTTGLGEGGAGVEIRFTPGFFFFIEGCEVLKRNRGEALVRAGIGFVL